MQLYKTLFFAARQGCGATEVQAASAAPAIHYLQVADQFPRAARTVTAPALSVCLQESIQVHLNQSEAVKGSISRSPGPAAQTEP